MSLLHWWPLNKNAKDIGLEPADLTVVTNTRSNVGKLAGCYTFSGASTQRMYANVAITPAITYCLWVKFDNVASACHVLDHRSSGGLNGTQPFYWAGSGGSGLQFYSTSGISQYTSPATLGITESNKWYHLALYMDNTHYGIYVNGVLKANYSKSGSAMNVSSQLFMIGCRCSGANPFKGSICDVRIYDEVLTKEQVHQISQGLLMHYDFEDPALYTGASRLNSTGEWSAYTSYWTISSQSADEINITKNGTTSSTVALQNSTLKAKLVANTPITVSMYLYKAGVPFQTSKTFTTTYNSVTVLSSESRADGYFRTTFKFGNLDSVWLMHTDFFGTCAAGTTCSIKHLQWEFGESASPYDESNFTTSTKVLYDSSGYEMNLNPVDVTSESLSGTGLGLGSFSGKFNGSTSVCKTKFENSPLNSADAFTINCWVKTTTAANQSLFTDRSGTGTGPALFIISGTSIRFDTNDTNCSYSNSNIKDGNWHMVTAVYDGAAATRKIYFDGTLVTTASSSTLGGVSSGYVGFGASATNNDTYNNFLNGSIADWKLYRTALSAADVLKEYRSMARIDKEYHLGARRFVEDPTRTTFAKLNRLGNFESKEIIETAGYESLYTPIESITSTGTQYINTGYYYVTENTELVADFEVLTNASNQSLWGNEEYYNSGSGRYFCGIPHGKNGSFSLYMGSGSLGTIAFGMNTRCLVHVKSEITSVSGSTVTKAITVTKNGTSILSTSTSQPILTYEKAYTKTSNTGRIFIFANHNSGTAGTTSGPTQNVSSMKLYRFQIWDDGKLVRDFIPVRRNSDSKVGLLDRTNFQFYTTPTGDFTAGSNTASLKKFQTMDDGRLFTTSFYEY